MHLDESLIRLLLLRLEQPGDTPMYVQFDAFNNLHSATVDTIVENVVDGGVVVCAEEEDQAVAAIANAPADPAFVIKGNLFAAELLAKIYAFTGHGRNCSYRNKGECDCLRNEIATALDDAGVEYA